MMKRGFLIIPALAIAAPAATMAQSTAPQPGGIINRPEARIPYRGFSPIVDFEPIGHEVMLLKSITGKWYRATLQPPCIGDSTMISDHLALIANGDGSFDRSSVLIVSEAPGNGLCRMLSLVESAPPPRRLAGPRTARVVMPDPIWPNMAQVHSLSGAGPQLQSLRCDPANPMDPC